MTETKLNLVAVLWLAFRQIRRALALQRGNLGLILSSGWKGIFSLQLLFISTLPKGHFNIMM